MTITQTVEVPFNRRITIEVPREIPTGRVILSFTPEVGDCPLCAKHHDSETGELRFSAETVAAFEEGDAMLRGEIPVKKYNSLEEILVDLDADD